MKNKYNTNYINFVMSLTAIIAGLFLFPLSICAESKKAPGHDRQKYVVFVDDNGVMRRSDTKEEVSYYGTNYTAPFAYSYRALGYLGKDRKEAIRKDVYHISRLGLNAFRLHLWDVELSDSLGNLLDNEHLDLLDFMIAEFEKRGIDIVLTAQTNFGNGYPEKNIDTGAFSYDFDKCMIHDLEEAQAIQQRYLSQLARHVNPYTGRSYAKDRAIIAIEINNEPCHSGTKEEVTQYIDRMAGTLRKSGFDRPILYNVTHNPGVTEAYYAADIDGTTYQWYPTGLVANHQRKGNFLPMLDNYSIAWKDTMPNYDRLARVVYEFDPADVLYSYLYPAIARTFRKEGFQWITQFAYDPLDIAQFNTEYPTHYLNLVYTPGKAISMMIAAEAAREIPRGKDYGNYPENTSFGHTKVSYENDLSVFNSPQKFLYTNSTDIQPEDVESLIQIAGHGQSLVVDYDGTGAYFLDRIEDSGLWRLEVLPDVTVISDPFADTSLKDTKVIATETPRQMKISLPQIGDNFMIKGISEGNDYETQASGKEFLISPGTYLIIPEGGDPGSLTDLSGTKVAGNIGLTEYYGSLPDKTPITLLSAKRYDSDIDVNAIPEAWDFRFNYGAGSWDEPSFYDINSQPAEDGMLVIKRYVGDKLRNVPFNQIKPFQTINISNPVQIGKKQGEGLPEGTEIAVVTRHGRTFSATLGEKNDLSGENKDVISIPLSSLRERKGIIVPAPYPSMMQREIANSDNAKETTIKPEDIEFIELIIPRNKGVENNWLLERIWIE